ncbi:CBS domain-containing protein [uncultured Neptuniibacter sp.]|uniref:CBS domain-containing protein n=1 Tax=uncultured Neptuniibacter sp. TaxID=502143 RepID=UPI0026287B38|nr:CBS domain-containing protein [uncultured Neptuniibacter sp.]
MSTLSNLIAKQIMSDELLTASEHWSIQTLIDFFNRHKVTGAPVLSSRQDFIGVVSISDVLTFDGNPKHNISENPLTQFYYNTLEGYTPDELGLSQGNQHMNHLVSEIMTPEIITADAETPVTELAAIMYRKGIHRIFITEDEQIKGAVSTLDILKLVADS